MSNKTISINPSLFSISGSKSKKNKEKKQKTTVTPLISPNVLKKKLLKRIKEHKQRETNNLENNTKKGGDIKNDVLEKINTNNFSDEFSESINYLQTLSKQKKNNDEKIYDEKVKQQKIQNLEKKTLKNFKWNDDINNNINSEYIYVSNELPEELQITTIKNQDVGDTPYGILKGGIKPTYRTWKKTQRNNIVTNPNSALIIQGEQINKQKTEREARLNNLREKLKQKQIENTIQQTEHIIQNENLIQKPNDNLFIVPNNEIQLNPEIKINPEIQLNPEIKINPEIQLNPEIQTLCNNSNNISNNISNNNDIIAIKKITKKTIKRKYTLGKSNIKKRVSVLLKDRKTRKQVLNAQKELKKKPINDIKNYLREHNLIKIGSTAPNDVIRKLYESCMLAGEITNSNSEVLLHNFSKDDKDL